MTEPTEPTLTEVIELAPDASERWNGYARRLLDKNHELLVGVYVMDGQPPLKTEIVEDDQTVARVESRIRSGGALWFNLTIYPEKGDGERFSWYTTDGNHYSLILEKGDFFLDYDMSDFSEAVDEAAVGRFEKALAAIEAEYDQLVAQKHKEEVYKRAIELFHTARVAIVVQAQLAALGSDPRDQEAIQLLTSFTDTELREFSWDNREKMRQVPHLSMKGIDQSALAALLQIPPSE